MKVKQKKMLIAGLDIKNGIIKISHHFHHSSHYLISQMKRLLTHQYTHKLYRQCLNSISVHMEMLNLKMDILYMTKVELKDIIQVI